MPNETERKDQAALMPPLLRCLGVILRIKGRPVSDQFLLAGLGGGKVTVTSCLSACREAGLTGEVVERELLDIPEMIMPCVLMLKENKCCVYVGNKEGKASLVLPNEPDTVYEVPLQRLKGMYAGKAIFVKVQPKISDRASSITPGVKSAWFWDVVRHYWPIYSHVAIASVVINLIAIASPLFVMNVYDRVVPNNAMETLWALAIGIFVIYIFNFFLTELRTHFVDTAAKNADIILQSRLIGKVLSMKMDARPESTGALVNNIREFEQVRDFFSSTSLLALIDIPFMLIFLIMIALIAGPLVFAPVAAIPVLVVIGLYLQHKTKETVRSNFKQNMHKNALLVEMVNGLEVVKACAAEKRMQKLWEAVNGLSAESQYLSRKYNAQAVAISTFATQLVTLIMIIWGCYLIAQGDITMGALIGVNILVGRLMAPLMKITGLLTRLQGSRIAFQALDMLMQLPGENQSDTSCMDPCMLPARFDMENVTFAYPGSKHPALRNASLHIETGEKIGIIGPMGSGKSTMVRLLLGFYEPQEGVVRFGDINIKQLPVADLRGRAGVCPQEVMLFYGTIKDNITLGDPIINDAMILEAAESAGVMDFLRDNPDGFAMQVGEQGRALSGGERQSVALARALVRDPEILILDEPTSDMDTETERIIQEKLNLAAQTRTLVLVTHRMSMLNIVDRLIVLKSGEIIMDGPKDEVLKGLMQMRNNGWEALQKARAA